MIVRESQFDRITQFDGITQFVQLVAVHFRINYGIVWYKPKEKPSFLQRASSIFYDY